jgi:pimeloyl-ACP methyl ester carboxylesterase
MIQKAATMRNLMAALTFSLISSLAFAQTPASPVAGAWEGAIDAGAVKLRIGVVITVKPDGVLSATMDSPDQGAFDMPLSNVTFADGTLKFALVKANGAFEGRVNAAGTEIAGTWTQGMAMPLVLTRVEKLSRPNRPQEPKPPFPYVSEEIPIVNAAGMAVLAGTLTRPKGQGPFPAVILLTGSGAQNRDEEVFGHKPFLVIADHLTRRGIAVLRYDDRGVGNSTGKFASATSEDFAGDAWAAWQVLAARPDIDAKRIGLLGHSEGGLIAPMLVAAHPEIAFVIMVGGPGVPGDQIMLAQATAIMKASGAPEAAITANTDLQKQIFTILREETSMARAAQRIEAIPAGSKEASAALVRQSASPWMRFFVLHDPATALAKVRCPVLAVGAEFDLQVLPEQNLPAIEAALKKGGNKDFTVLRLSGLNHLLQPAKTGLPAEYAQIETTIAPAALETITTWIQKRTGLAK